MMSTSASLQAHRQLSLKPVAAARSGAAAPVARLHSAGCGCPLHRAKQSVLPQHRQSGLARRADRSQQAAVRPAAFYAPQGPPPPPHVDPDWKEESRKGMRSVFDFDRWRTHRSSSRYLRHALGLFESRIVGGLAAPLAYVMSVASAVALYHLAVDAGYLPVWPELKLASSAPFGLTSFALSLLLVFRTNSSYGRWDEARKMWGLVVNRSRDFARQGLGYIPDSQPELQTMLCRWIVAYSKSLMCHLRPNENLAGELKHVLLPQELEALLASAHRPNYCCQVLTAILKEAQLPGSNPKNWDSTAVVPAGAAYRMDEQLTVFADVTGGCERILRTPIPLSYTRHTSRFMMIWLTLMPFSLWDGCKWAMLPISGIVAFLLLGIEEIGVQCEEPFTMLPLEAICTTIETNVRELHKFHAADQRMVEGNNTVPAVALLPSGGAALAAAANGNGNGNGSSSAVVQKLEASLEAELAEQGEVLQQIKDILKK